jgi:hypothetical protein
MNDLITLLTALIELNRLSLPLTPQAVQAISLNVLPAVARQIYLNNTTSAQKVSVQNPSATAANAISIAATPITGLTQGHQLLDYAVADFVVMPGQRLYGVGVGASPIAVLIQY